MTSRDPYQPGLFYDSEKSMITNLKKVSNFLFKFSNSKNSSSALRIWVILFNCIIHDTQ